MNTKIIAAIGVGLTILGTSHNAYPQTLDQTNMILQYCIEHADRVAYGENVTQDLVLSGLLPLYLSNITCADAQLEHDVAEGFKDFLRAYVDSRK